MASTIDAVNQVIENYCKLKKLFKYLSMISNKGVSGFKSINPTAPTTTSVIPIVPTTSKPNSVCNFEVGYNYPQIDIGYRANATLADCCKFCALNLNCQGFSYLVNNLFCFFKGFGFKNGKREPYPGMISSVILIR